MAVGAASETVTVEANTIAVQSDSGELSNLISDKQVRNSQSMDAALPTCTVNAGRFEPNQQFRQHPGRRRLQRRIQRHAPEHNIYLLDGGEDDDRGGAVA